MTGQAIEPDDEGEEEKTPAGIWGTNGGIYLGLTPVGRTDQRRPLARKELDDSVPRGARFRSTWKPDGGLNLYVGEGHVATFGPQGVGKTRKLFMPNLLKLRDWSIVVIDPKGENCAHTALARAANPNHRVHVVDPFEVIPTNYPRLFASNPALFTSCGFNMLAALKPKSLIDDAKAIAMALIQSDDARDPYWPMAAQALAKGVIMALRLDKPGVSDSLAVFRSYLGLKPQEFAEAIERDIAKFGEKWPAVAASLGEFATHNPDDKELGGIRRTAKAQTDWLDSPLIRKDLSRKNVFDFASLKETPTTVYLILPPDQLVTHGTWLRLMVTAALRPLMRSVEPARVPVLFMLDEFAQLGKMSIIEQNIAQLRGYGVKLWTVWQHLEQMKKVYRDAWPDFMATAEQKITFTSNDVETREYFSKLSGERLFKHVTVSKTKTTGTNTSNNWNHNATFGGGDGTNTSESMATGEQHINERCVRPYEIAALDADEALIFARRGMMHRSICPQPEELFRDQMQQARSTITGRPLPALTVAPGVTAPPASA